MDNWAAALRLSWLSCLCFCVNNGAEKTLLSKPIKAFLLCRVSVTRCTLLSLHPVSVWLHILLSALVPAPTDLALGWVWGNWRVPHCSLASVLARRGWPEVRQLWSQRTEAGGGQQSGQQPHNKWQRQSSAGLLSAQYSCTGLHCLHSLSAAEHWLLFIQSQDTAWHVLLGRGSPMVSAPALVLCIYRLFYSVAEHSSLQPPHCTAASLKL